jgi:hypothetical protein
MGGWKESVEEAFALGHDHDNLTTENISMFKIIKRLPLTTISVIISSDVQPIKSGTEL